MGYTTDFEGSFKVSPPLNEKEVAYLNAFNDSRRMARGKGPYYVDGGGFMGQNNDPDVTSMNNPPEEQPSLWCQWVPNEDGTEIAWDGGEKFYSALEWMEYLIKHFIGSNPKAKSEERPFFEPHVVNGFVTASGEEPGDHWAIEVIDNVVHHRQGAVEYS
jgi:hypothetical protein